MYIQELTYNQIEGTDVEIVSFRGGIDMISFAEYLEEYEGISWQYFDNNYADSQANETWERYLEYLEGLNDGHFCDPRICKKGELNMATYIINEKRQSGGLSYKEYSWGEVLKFFNAPFDLENIFDLGDWYEKEYGTSFDYDVEIWRNEEGEIIEK